MYVLGRPLLSLSIGFLVSKREKDRLDIALEAMILGGKSVAGTAI